MSGVALAARDEGSLHAAISIFGTLLESEDESVEDEEFARSLMVLVKGVKASDPVVVRSGVQSDVVELLFGVATKIRLQPGVLSSWFKPKRSPRTPVGGDTTDHADADPTHEEQFPLFYALMDYVHYESPVGDFARTGLLYIIESASNFQELEHWMVDCDLATLMASGLGALYSQLHRSSPPDRFNTEAADLATESSSCPFRTKAYRRFWLCPTTRTLNPPRMLSPPTHPSSAFTWRLFYRIYCSGRMSSNTAVPSR